MKDTLQSIKAELTEAYSLLSMISVSGDDVDRLAEARVHLRKAFHTAKESAAALAAGEQETGNTGAVKNG